MSTYMYIGDDIYVVQSLLRILVLLRFSQNAA